jgi:hypothetical protein
LAIEADPPLQRAYRAACPNCGAPVDFRSAASAFAVCGFCRSTLVREGEALRRIGESAEVFDDHSPLQVGASGRFHGAGFALVGRLQYRYAQGTWNEWHALFDNGRSGWLSEDNGGHVFAFEQTLAEGDGAVPPAERLVVGGGLTVAGRRWSVASVTTARLSAAQGELPRPPDTARAFVVADLRSTADEVGTLDYTEAGRPRWSIGRPVALADLALVGLKDGGAGGPGSASEKSLGAGSLSCPNCGAALEVTLSTTQSIVCHQCHSVIDVSQGLGGDLRHYAQDNGSEPLIPLGSVGQFQFGRRPLLPWQVVGYVERCEVPAESEDEEQSFWREYLLYHRSAGFAFLVDADDGWSWAIPLTGVPQQGAGDKVTHQGTVYRKRWDYTGRITYVLGEFYWQLQRGQSTFNTDYQAAGKCLNRERTGQGGEQEVVWSAGETLTAKAVSQAFRLAPDKDAALQRDVLPTSSSSGMHGLLAKAFFWVFVVVLLLMLFRCGSSSSDCGNERRAYGESSQEYQSCLRNNRSRTGGGSFGGFSSGGGHK